MDNTGSDRRSIPRAIQELGQGLQHVMTSELKLARAEAAEALGRTGRNSAYIVVAAVVAALSILPFVAFLVIGLGKILGGIYWLSSLIVAVVMAVIGGLVAYGIYRSTRYRDLSLPETRKSIDGQRHAVEGKIRELAPRGRSSGGISATGGDLS